MKCLTEGRKPSGVQGGRRGTSHTSLIHGTSLISARAPVAGYTRRAGRKNHGKVLHRHERMVAARGVVEDAKGEEQPQQESSNWDEEDETQLFQDRIEIAIQEAKTAQHEYSKFTQEQVDKIFKEAALEANMNRIPLAKLAVKETGACLHVLTHGMWHTGINSHQLFISMYKYEYAHYDYNTMLLVQVSVWWKIR